MAFLYQDHRQIQEKPISLHSQIRQAEIVRFLIESAAGTADSSREDGIRLAGRFSRLLGNRDRQRGAVELGLKSFVDETVSKTQPELIVAHSLANPRGLLGLTPGCSDRQIGRVHFQIDAGRIRTGKANDQR
jgi:hypothetical protein